MDSVDFNGTKEDFLDIWCDIFALNEPMALTLATLPQRLPAYLFSNTNGPHLRYLLDRFAIFKHFDDGIYSHEAKCMKPATACMSKPSPGLGSIPRRRFMPMTCQPTSPPADALALSATSMIPPIMRRFIGR